MKSYCLCPYLRFSWRELSRHKDCMANCHQEEVHGPTVTCTLPAIQWHHKKAGFWRCGIAGGRVIKYSSKEEHIILDIYASVSGGSWPPTHGPVARGACQLGHTHPSKPSVTHQFSQNGCFCKFGGPICGRPCNESAIILGSTLGPLIFRNSQI